MQYTLSILKPDAVQRNLIGKINTYFEDAGLQIVAMKMLHLSESQASEFYQVHSHRPFFKDLVSIMSSGPVVVQVLAGENAIAKNRDIMGATNPEQAEAGTIRKDHGISIDINTVHGSDSEENAKIEIDFFFTKEELHAR